MKILILEDVREDAELVVHKLTRAGLVVDWQLARNETEFQRLLSPDFDLILADYTLPGYNALQALALMKERRIAIPCIIVSGTIGEERAVECLRHGAKDYILKDRMGRLGQAVQNALAEQVEHTARLAAEEELRNTLSKLELRNAEMEGFCYNISHELKSPLVTIGGFLGVIRQTLGAEGLAQVSTEFGFVEEASSTLKARIDLLLNLARAGIVSGVPDILELEQLALQTLGLLDYPLKENRIQVNIQPGLPRVVANRIRISEVLENLISNAIKFMGDQPQPVIEIGGRVEAGIAVCFVRDNGVGIDPVHQNRLFRLFERLEQNIPGEGIGLALVQRIIETHQGKVWLESAGKGCGSTVFFTLPAAEVATLGADQQQATAVPVDDSCRATLSS